MSLHNARSRGTSIVEYALLLFVFIVGSAAAIKTTGLSLRDAVDASGGEIGLRSEGSGMRPPVQRDGGMP